MAEINAKTCKNIMDAQIHMMCTIRDAVEATEDSAEHDALAGFYDTCVDVFNKFNDENAISCTRAQKIMLTILGLGSIEKKPKEESKAKEEPKEEPKEVDEEALPPELKKVIKSIVDFLDK